MIADQQRIAVGCRANRWCCFFHAIPQKPDEGAVRRVADALKPQPLQSLWTRPVSQKNTGRTHQTKSPSTTHPASVSMAGQNPLSEKTKQRGHVAQDRKGHIAPRILNSPTKSQHEASHLKPEGRREAERVRSCNARINVYTYNTRTLRTDDGIHRLVEELGNIKLASSWAMRNRRGEGLR